MLKVEIAKTGDLIPYVNNSKLHPEEQIAQIAASIKEFGFNDPIAIDGENVIIEGHGRLLAAMRLKLDEVPIIRLNHLTEMQKKAYIIAHNKLTLNSWFDEDILKVELEELDRIGYDMDLTGFDKVELGGLLNTEEPGTLPGEEKYTAKITAPVYTPSDETPEVSSLYDETKTISLMERIERTEIDEDIKIFLRIAANRHTVLDFSKIADYYAAADVEVQELMEDSALVIIDFNKAIENGYIELSKNLMEQHKADHPGENDDEE